MTRLVNAETLAAALESVADHPIGVADFQTYATAILAAIPPDDRYCDGCGASVLSMRHFNGCPVSPDPRLDALLAAARAVDETLRQVPGGGRRHGLLVAPTKGRAFELAALALRDALAAFEVSVLRGEPTQEKV